MRNYDEPAVAGALCVGLAMLSCLAGQAAAQCVGDCDGNGAVTINELIVGVAIALGNQPSSACPAFQNAQGEVSIAQLIQGVNDALGGCPEDGLLGGPPGGRALDAVRDQFSPDAYVLPEEPGTGLHDARKRGDVLHPRCCRRRRSGLDRESARQRLAG